MMNSFCAASNLKVFMKRPGCPDVLKDLAPAFEDCFPPGKRGTLMADIHTFGGRTGPLAKAGKCVQLEKDIYNAFIHTVGSRSSEVNLSTVHVYPRWYIEGLQFATRDATQRDSIVFYKRMRSDTLIPGVIRLIFSSSSLPGETFLAIHRYLPLSGNNTHDPFLMYVDFGASIWSNELDDEVDVVPTTQKIYHTCQREWCPNTVVMRPTNKVILMYRCLNWH
jgi:hypothetical protein